MTRQHLIHKWLVYALALIPIWMLDCYVLGRYPISGATPMLLPLAVAAVATLEGPTAGGAYAMGVGFLWETTYPGGTGFLIFYLTVLGSLCGAGVKYILQKGFFGYFICAATILVAVELAWVLAWLLAGTGSWEEIFPLALRQTGLSLCYTPLVYLIFRRVFRKVGGTRLA